MDDIHSFIISSELLMYLQIRANPGQITGFIDFWTGNKKAQPLQQTIA